MNLIKSIAFGISMGCTVFVIVNLIGYWSIGTSFLEAVMDNFTQHVAGSIMIGLACILPTHIYKVERLTFLQQSGFHFFIAIGIFIVVAFTLKWIPTFSVKITVVMLLLSVVVFTLVWLLFYFYSQSEVRKMKSKISNLSDD